MASARTSQRALIGVTALLFVGSAVATIAWSTSMSAIGAMPMPGGWSMSMTWMRMSGQTWAGAAASFVAMWTVMMIAMMLPSLVPMLIRYRRSVGDSGEARLAMLTAVVAVGYFTVWSALGVVVFPLGAALAAAELRLPVLARVVPVATGVVVMMAGALQLTRWKARHLEWDHDTRSHGCAMTADASTAWRHGLCLGVHCSYCCAGLTASFLALGAMDLRVMAVVTAAITLERLAPVSMRAARAVGVLGVITGALLIARG